MQSKRYIQFAAGLQLQVVLVVNNPLANAGDKGFFFHDTDISEVDGLIVLQAAPWSGLV